MFVIQIIGRIRLIHVRGAAFTNYTVRLVIQIVAYRCKCLFFVSLDNVLFHLLVQITCARSRIFIQNTRLVRTCIHVLVKRIKCSGYRRIYIALNQGRRFARSGGCP